MGQEERARENGKDKKRLKTRSVTQRQAIEPEALPADAVADLIIAVVRQGGAVRFGATRDGGAWCVAVYLGGDVSTGYSGADEDFEGFLRDAIGEVEARPH